MDLINDFSCETVLQRSGGVPSLAEYLQEQDGRELFKRFRISPLYPGSGVALDCIVERKERKIPELCTLTHFDLGAF